MQHNRLRHLTLSTAAAAWGAVLLAGVARAFGGVLPGGAYPYDFAYRTISVAAGLLALGALVAGGRRLRSLQPFVAAGYAVLAILSLAGPTLAGSSSTAAVGAAVLASGLAAAVHAGGEEPWHSRLSMFRSQWQVPLYAALATYTVTVLGGYLKSLGAAAACQGWPLCSSAWTGPITPVEIAHLVHRAAALMAGLLLAYTVWFVWRRHASRPLLLVLTGSAVILYSTQVLLGVQASEGGLSAWGSFAHMAIATALVSTLLAISAVGYYMPTLPVIAGASAAVALPAPRSFSEVARDYLMLTKPRIIILLLLTGYAAMWVAAKGLPNIGLTLITMLGLGISCGAANAINMWYDRDIDSVMARTQKRPIPAGRLTPEQVLGFGILAGALSFVLLAAAVNLMAAVLSLAGLLFYVLIYTMWLKRSTDQNIVIGGAAGSIPPLVGWAAVTGDLSWAPIIMFLIVFMWTPPHFWALALFRNDDYRRAGVPMLPVVRGEMVTKGQILLYSVLLFPTVIALYWTGVVGQVYLWISVGVSAVYLAANLMLFTERAPVFKWARRSFFWSLFYLAFIFVAMVVDIT